MKLRYRSGRVLLVARHRPDGWPICPSCGEDELAHVRGGEFRADVRFINRCYRCGSVDVVGDEVPVELAPREQSPGERAFSGPLPPPPLDLPGGVPVPFVASRPDLGATVVGGLKSDPVYPRHEDAFKGQLVASDWNVIEHEVISRPLAVEGVPLEASRVAATRWRSAPHQYDPERRNVVGPDEHGSDVVLVEDVEPAMAALIAAAPEMKYLLRRIHDEVLEPLGLRPEIAELIERIDEAAK